MTQFQLVDSGSAADADLYDRLRRGEEGALESFLRRHGGRMLALAERILSDAEKARDAVRTAFLSAFRAIDEAPHGSLRSAWLHRIVVREALRRIRESEMSPEGPDLLLPVFDDTGHRTPPGRPWRDASADPGSRENVRAFVRRAILSLPTHHRVVLVLHDVEGMGTRETADLLDLPEIEVKARLHRARQALTTLLDEIMVAGPDAT